jgi:hypothetical protein
MHNFVDAQRGATPVAEPAQPKQSRFLTRRANRGSPSCDECGRSGASGAGTVVVRDLDSNAAWSEIRSGSRRWSSGNVNVGVN